MNAERDSASPNLIVSTRVGGAESPPRRLVPIAAGLILSCILGIVLLYVPPLMVIGAVVGLLSACIVLRYPFAGLLLYTIVYMWRPAEAYPVLLPLRLEFVIGALTFAAMIVDRYRCHGAVSLDSTRISLLLALVTFTMAISVPFAFWKAAALSEFESFLKIGVWYLIVAHLLTTPLRFRAFSVVFLVLICQLAFDALRAYFAGNVQFTMGIDRLIGQNEAAGNPNAVAATCAATIPILLLLAFQRRLRHYRVLAAAGVVLLTVALSLTGSRSGFLAFLAMLIYLWTRSRHRVVIGLAGVTLLGAGLLILPDQYKTRYSSITAEERDASSQLRIVTWEKGVRMVLDRPLTGVGIGCFSVANAMGYSSESQRSWLQPHSLYIQVPSEVGLTGAVFFFWYLVELFRTGARSRRRLSERENEFWFEETVLRGMLAGLVALLVAGAFGHSFMRYTWYVYGAMIVAATRMVWRLQNATQQRDSIGALAETTKRV